MRICSVDLWSVDIMLREAVTKCSIWRAEQKRLSEKIKQVKSSMCVIADLIVL